MSMNDRPNPLIEGLAAELEPVRVPTRREGLAWIALAVAATVLAVELVEGLWRGILAGHASAMFWIANGLLVVLGVAAATSAVTMAGPRVGNRHSAPAWAMAALAVLPLAVLATLVTGSETHSPLADRHGIGCALGGFAAGTLTAAALVLWLRRGAPVSPAAAGLHAGVAAGALGSAAVGLSCPIDGTMHLGIWHVLPVAMGAAIGRLAIPPLVRW